jgi:hypothetical protein
VFGKRGFSGSNLTDAMRLAGADVDSLYCRPVLMDELFVILWEDHYSAHAEAVSAAIAQVRQSGVTDPGKLFETGARAFLQGSWRRRDLALLFSSGDAPAGFPAMRQRLRREWLRRNAVLLRLDDSPEDRLYGASLTSLISRGAREVATAGDFRQAQAMIDAVVGYARLLVADRPTASSRPARRCVALPGVSGLGPATSS